MVKKLHETDYQKEWIKPGGGWSAIIGPGGGILSGPLTDEEGILFAEIDLEAIIDMAHWHDATGHYARPDVASLLLNREKYTPVKKLRRDHIAIQPPVAGLESIKRRFDQLKARVDALEDDDELKGIAGQFERELSTLLMS